MTPFQMKILAVILSTGAVVGAGWYIHGKIYDKGFTACETVYKDALNKAKEQARKEIISIGETYEKQREEIIRKGDSGHGVGARTVDMLDWLRNNPRN